MQDVVTRRVVLFAILANTANESLRHDSDDRRGDHEGVDSDFGES